jgi:regulator of sigma E protease
MEVLFETIVNLLWFVVPAGAVLGVLIFVHELGHFIAARLVGIRVEVFSIGFGKRLFGFRRGATDYRVSAIPFGGYVRMAGEDLPGQGKSDSPESDKTDKAKQPDLLHTASNQNNTPGDRLNDKTVPQRILVAVAGALMNAVLAIILTIGLAYFGIHVESYLLETPVIAHVQDNSPAHLAGLQSGDEIRSINDVSVETWEDTQMEILLRFQEPIEITVQRNSRQINTVIVPDDDKTYPFHGIGTPSNIFIGSLAKNSPAEKAGLKPDDQIVSVNDTSMKSIYQLMDAVNQSDGNTVSLSVIRDDELYDISLNPEYNEEFDRYMIGIAFAPDPDRVLRRYPALESVRKGIELNIQMSQAMFVLVGRLVSGRESIDQLGGPVMILDMAGQAARTGIRDLIWLTALISLNLAILNLLPIPVLDGGMVIFLIYEGVFRRPVSEKIQIALQNVFFFLLIGFMLFVTYNDLIRKFQ